MAHNLKVKILTLMTKLSDRDTYAAAAAELDSIAATLDSSTLPIFLSCILSTGSTDKPLVRRHCLTLISTLSLHLRPPNSLSPSLPKILSFISRRLRDSDSCVRTNCVNAVSNLASTIMNPPFSSSFLKPLSELVFTERDSNGQVGSALCLAAAIDAAPDPEPGRLMKVLVPKVERVLRSESYKAKSAGLVLIGSVIGVGGVRGYGGRDGLVKCLVGFLSCGDWAARKAAAEALGRLAVVERDAMAEFKVGCLKVFENRRFDKVKTVREVMSQMIEAWKRVPDVSEEASPPPLSLASSKDDASDGLYPPGSKNSSIAGSGYPQMKKRTVLTARTPGSSSAAPTRMGGPPKSAEKKKSPSMFRKVDCKNPLDWKVEISIPNGNSLTDLGDNDLKEKNDNIPERRLANPEVKRALFSKNSDDNMLKFSGFKSGSRVAPCDEVRPESTVVISNISENHHINHKECEDLSQIRNQLVQIERQQSSLLDLLQRFIGSSQNGMHSLETRVQGLELALDEISYDLAVSNGRMTNVDSHRTTCCLIPGASFLRSKLRKKTEGSTSVSRFSSRSGTSCAIHRQAAKNSIAENVENRRVRLQGRHGLIVNPLAEIHGVSRQMPEVTQN